MKRFDSALFGKGDFQTRLFRTFIIVGIPIFAAITLCAYSFLQRSTNDEICEEQARELAATEAKLRYVVADVESISEEILCESSVQEMMEASYQGERYPSDTLVSYYINNLIANRDYVNGIVLSGTDHNLFSTERIFTNLSSFSRVQEKWWFPDLKSGEKPCSWYPCADLSEGQYGGLVNGTVQTENDILFARPVYSMEDYNTCLGYLMIYLRNEYLQEIWDSNFWGNTTNIFLIDENGDLLAGNHTKGDYMDELDVFMKTNPYVGTDGISRMMRMNGQTYVCSARSFGENGWQIRMIVPYAEINKSTIQLRMELLLIIAAFVFVMFLLSRLAAGNAAQPIVQLSRIMDEVHGRKTQDEAEEEKICKMYAERSDEVGQMYRSYANMQERQNTLIRDIYIKDLEKKDAELALLQTQINPHFLYNTLNSINWLALANDQEEISQMITALSDTFRLSLMKNNSAFTLLEQELQYVESYLLLQKFRYGTRLVYEMNLPDTIPSCYIPRFILQPVIENALKHGIDSDEDGGRLDLSLMMGDRLIITVGNDYDQIDLKQMEQLLDFDPDAGDFLSFDQHGYGVQNINRRIRILCGEEYGLNYAVKEGRTYCSILLPFLTEDPNRTNREMSAARNGREAVLNREYSAETEEQ